MQGTLLARLRLSLLPVLLLVGLSSFSGSRNAEAGIKLALDPVPAIHQITGYRIYYGTESGQRQGFMAIGNTTTYEFTNLDMNQDWYFVATAYRNCVSGSLCGESSPGVGIPCAAGQICESGFSNEAHYIPAPPLPLAALATNGALTWRVVDDEPIDLLNGDGAFNSSSGWILSGWGWTISDGVARNRGWFTNSLSHAVNMTVGNQYRITFEVKSYTSGTLSVTSPTGVGTVAVDNTIGPRSIYGTCTAAVSTITFSGRWAGTLDNVTVERIN